MRKLGAWICVLVVAGVLGLVMMTRSCTHPLQASAPAAQSDGDVEPSSTPTTVPAPATPDTAGPASPTSAPQATATSVPAASRRAPTSTTKATVATPSAPSAPSATTTAPARPAVKPARQLVFDGQSLNITPFSGPTYPTRLLAMVPAGLPGTVVAVQRTTYAERAATAATRVDPVLAGAQRTTLLDLAGQSDLLTDMPAADVLAGAESYAAARRAAGASEIVVFTVPPSTWFTAAQDRERIAYNQLLRTSTRFDGLVDLAALTELQDATDTRFYEDGIHPTVAGAEVIARAAYVTLAPMLGLELL
jgi:hypothetical protein